MYLLKIDIKGFRSYEDAHISFDEHLTALVGENNSGKSNVIDAIRLVTAPLNDRRDRYCEDSDVKDGSETKQFTIEAHYKGLNMTQKGMLISAVPDPAKDVAIFGISYQATTKLKPRGETKYWAGSHKLEPEVGAASLIRHVYLPPLRDAQRALSSGNSGSILRLLRHFLDDTLDEQEFVQSLGRKTENNDTINLINKNVGNILKNVTEGVRHQITSLGFSTNDTLHDIARDLRFKLSDHDIDLKDLSHSGLGFANLLFISTILVELEKAQDADLTIFLVEEPEAHLHPQLQSSILSFLLEQAKNSQHKEKISGKPEGKIQIIVTTHSPNLAAGIHPKHLTIIRSVKNENVPKQSIAIPIKDLDIEIDELNKLQRYIDVTKSSLLFGQKCLLVEGIAEAILLPAIACKYVFMEQGEEAKEKLRKFNATSLVFIDGVDFKPYIKVLLSKYKGHCLCDFVVVITDGDPNNLGDRKTNLEKLAGELGSSTNLEVFTNTRTLEHELFSPKNEALIKEIYLEIHPRSINIWEEKIEAKQEDDKKLAFVQFFKDKKVRKGDFIQRLVDKLNSEPLRFTPPDYLLKAIKAIVQ